LQGATVAFEGIEARAVDVQVQVAPGLPAFAIVGLPDKAVSEARERVRSALIASGLALPARRITVNLAPADLPKEGSHYDLPIALGLIAAIGANRFAISSSNTLDHRCHLLTIGHSYIRFSTPEQAKGDSLRRQTEGAQGLGGTARHSLGYRAHLRGQGHLSTWPIRNEFPSRGGE
jgi:Subunit ChlI of Mg-chelatase